MKLLDISVKRSEKWGNDYYIYFIKTKKYSLIQLCISFLESPDYPFLQINFGNNGLFGILFWVYKFGMDIDLIGRTWYFDEDNSSVDT